MKQALENFFLAVHNKMTFVFLIILYILLVGPTALYLRIIRHKFLRSVGGDSTWVNVEPVENGADSYLKQF